MPTQTKTTTNNTLTATQVVEARTTATTPAQKAAATRLRARYITQQTQAGYNPTGVENALRALESRLANA